MDLTGKSSKEIQQAIFDRIAAGVDAEQLKQELRAQGIPVEGYYFISKKAYEEDVVQLPKETPSAGISAWQIIVTILLVIVTIWRVVRCTNAVNR